MGIRCRVNIIAMTLLLTAVSMCGEILGIPRADSNIEHAVPYANIEKIARLKGQTLWGDVVFGPVIPYVDVDGKVIAYLFNFYLGGQQFPSYQEINSKINKGSEISPAHNQGNSWQQDFGYIVISARYDQVPIIEYANHLPQYYLRGGPAKALARSRLGVTNPTLVRIYYGGPLEQWFEFEGQEETVLVDAYTLKSYAKERLVRVNNRKNRGNAVIIDRVEQAWQTLEKFEPELGYCSRDSNVIYGVPFYIWTYACCPTASSMLMGYWDNRGYGRLIDYYYDHTDAIHQQTVYNMPNVQKELAIAMGTDTATTGVTQLDSIHIGHIRLTNDINGYSFSSTGTYGDSSNDWCWDSIRSEIDAGRPFNWVVKDYLRIGPHHGEIDTMFPVGHCLAAIGYIDNGAMENNFVVVHDTWNAYVTYWVLYTVYQGVTSWDMVNTLIPGGFDSNNVRLTYPTGGEVLVSDSTYDIIWTSEGPDIEHVSLYYSSDNCENWQTINDSAPNTGSYAWATPIVDLEDVRIRIDAYDGSNFLLAGDASRDNFQVTTGYASGIDTIAYEHYTPWYVDALPTVFNGYPLDYYNVRFTPVDDCSLLAAQLYFARKGGTGYTLRVYVWSDSGGYPYEMIDSVDVPEDSIHTRHDETGWTRAYFTDRNIAFPRFEDFHVGYSLINAGPEDSLPVIADYGFTERSGVYWNGSFVTLHSLTGAGQNYFIDAIVSYDYVGCEDSKQPYVEISPISSVGQIYPNPFRQSTTIGYQLSARANVSLTIYDVIGRKVKTLVSNELNTGYYEINWSGRDERGLKVAAGVYFIQMTTDEYKSQEKVVFLH